MMIQLEKKTITITTMPLIIITGFPSSGKSTRAKQIQTFLRTKIAASEDEKFRRMRLHLVNDESLNISRNAYKDPQEEKRARGTFMSAIERLTSKDDIVIADGMNYIKGFRYQLYCIARGIGTPHGVVHCGVPVEICRERNLTRDHEAYDPIVFEELVSRYEEPIEQNRWDSPLFTVLYDDVDVPGEAIWDGIILRKPPNPNLSTVVQPVSETNYVYELDKLTQDVINAILDQQKLLGPSGPPIRVPRTTKTVVNPPRILTLPELRRLRRQFTNINKSRVTLDMKKLAEMFVEYLNTNIS